MKKRLLKFKVELTVVKKLDEFDEEPTPKDVEQEVEDILKDGDVKVKAIKAVRQKDDKD